jgi:hypothetical protein
LGKRSLLRRPLLARENVEIDPVSAPSFAAISASRADFYWASGPPSAMAAFGAYMRKLWFFPKHRNARKLAVTDWKSDRLRKSGISLRNISLNALYTIFNILSAFPFRGILSDNRLEVSNSVLISGLPLVRTKHRYAL